MGDEKELFCPDGVIGLSSLDPVLEPPIDHNSKLYHLNMEERSAHRPSGILHESDYANEELYTQLKDVHARLLSQSFFSSSNHNSIPEVARLIFQLRKFMAEHFDPCKKPSSAAATPSTTNIPIQHFRDCRENGALFTILAACFKFKLEMHWTAFSFDDMEKFNDNMALFESIEEALLSTNQLKNPKVYFSPGMESSRQQKLCEIIKKHHGETTLLKEEATYIVEYEEEIDALERADVLAHQHQQLEQAIVEVREKSGKALVHFQYFPNSYDQWMDKSATSGLSPLSACPLPYIVNCRFIYDLEIFNEWMNPQDYVLRKYSPTKKEKTTTSSPMDIDNNVHDAKRKEPIEEEEDKSETERNAAKRSRTEIENVIPSQPHSSLSSNTNHTNAEEDLEIKKAMEGTSAASSRPPLRYTNLCTGKISALPERTFAVTGGETGSAIKSMLPSCSAWFRINAINAIEKRMLPEFFNSKSVSKTPQVYMQYRNYMVNAYRQDPNVYLNATACRRNLAGDVCAILRVHEFLEHWGIINFQVPPAARPTTASPISQHFYSRVLGSGNIYPEALFMSGSSDSSTRPQPSHNNVPTTMDHPKSTTTTTSPSKCVLCTKTCSNVMYVLSESARQKLTSDALTAFDVVVPRGSSTSGICEICFQSKKYESLKTKQSFTTVHPDGGGNNNTSSTTSLIATDFTRKEISSSHSWTREELKRLLMAIYAESHESEKDENQDRNPMKAEAEQDSMDVQQQSSSSASTDGEYDWDDIAKAVKTKDRIECIEYFLQLPLERVMKQFENDGQELDVDALVLELEQELQTRDAQNHTGMPSPFGDLANPELSQVAYLIAQVHPQVAAAASKAALKEIIHFHSAPAMKTHETTTTAAEPKVDFVQDSIEAGIIQASQHLVKSGLESGLQSRMSSVPGKVLTSIPPPDASQKLQVLKETTAATAIASLAVNAQVQVFEKDQAIRQMMYQLMEVQVQKMELGLTRVRVLEKSVQREEARLHQERYDLYYKKLALAAEELDKRNTDTTSNMTNH